MSRFVFHPQAASELEDGIVWYEQQRSGLGREFRTATERTLNRIAERPLAYAKLLGHWRRALVPKFPYSIIYRPAGDTIYVLSCFHTHRNPRHWRKRI